MNSVTTTLSSGKDTVKLIPSPPKSKISQSRYIRNKKYISYNSKSLNDDKILTEEEKKQIFNLLFG